MSRYMEAIEYILKHPEESIEAQQGRLGVALIVDSMQALVDRLEADND